MVSITNLNKLAQKRLGELLQKDINELNDDNIAFLKARRDYLTDEQLKKYADIFEPKKKTKKKAKK